MLTNDVSGHISRPSVLSHGAPMCVGTREDLSLKQRRYCAARDTLVKS